MGFDSPSRHHLTFYLQHVAGKEVLETDPSGTNTGHCVSILFSILYGFRGRLGRSHLYTRSYIGSITECAADKWSAQAAKPESIYVMERTLDRGRLGVQLNRESIASRTASMLAFADCSCVLSRTSGAKGSS